jgi:hypothetical protein
VEYLFLSLIFRENLSCELYSIGAKIEQNLLKQTYVGKKLFRHVKKGKVIIGDLRLKINLALKQVNKE